MLSVDINYGHMKMIFSCIDITMLNFDCMMSEKFDMPILTYINRRGGSVAEIVRLACQSPWSGQTQFVNAGCGSSTNKGSATGVSVTCPRR